VQEVRQVKGLSSSIFLNTEYWLHPLVLRLWIIEDKQ